MSTKRQAPLGLFYGWWRGDDLPELPAITGMRIEKVTDPAALAGSLSLGRDDIDQRAREQHSLYIATINGDLVGWGWSAAGSADIGELGISMNMPPVNRYLWDFVTLPEWRGRGIYPALIQEMIRQQPKVERFWIGHDYGNRASGKGILRAGFRLVCELYQGPDGYYLTLVDEPERATIAADLLGVPLQG